MVYCPECETDLDIDEDEVDEGAVVSCPECGTDFEVITVNPVALKPVGEDEDLEDEDEEDADEEEDEDEDSSRSLHIAGRSGDLSRWPRQSCSWRVTLPLRTRGGAGARSR